MSLNQADAMFLANKYVEQPDLPSRIGYEIAGVVDALREGTKRFGVGVRVSFILVFSIREHGNLGELTNLLDETLMHTSPNLDNRQASSFTFAYFTNYVGLLSPASWDVFKQL